MNGPVIIATAEARLARDLHRKLTRIGLASVRLHGTRDELLQRIGASAGRLVLWDLAGDTPAAGVQALQQIQQRWNLPAVLIAPPAAERQLPAGPGGLRAPCLTKPCDEHELRSVLALVLDRQQLADELRRQTALNLAFRSASTEAFWMLDAHGIVRDANMAAGALLGREREELLGQPVAELEHEAAPSAWMAAIPRLLNQGQGQLTAHLRHRDGHLVTVSLNVVAPATLRPTLYCFGHDAAAAATAPARLQHLTRAVEQCPVSIVITDLTGRIEYVNPHFERATGYSAAEAVGLNPRVLKSGLQPASFYADLWQTLVAGRTWSGEFHNRRKDGSLFWERASISPMRDAHGRVTHFVAVKEDITTQRQAAEELARRESYESALLENQRGPVWLKDRAGRLLMVNQAYARLLGVRAPAQLIGLPEQCLWDQAQAAAIAGEDQAVLEAGAGRIWERALPLAGQMRWWEIYKTPVFDAAGTIIGLAGSAVDVTERHASRAQLVQAKEQAEAASRAKSAFLAAMSHELRTPLNVINSVAASLLDHSLPDDLRPSIELSLQSGKTLLTFVERIIDYAALESAPRPLAPETFTLRPWLQNLLNEISPTVLPHTTTLTLRIAPEVPPQLHLDARLLRQSLFGLVQNAIRHSRHGHVHLSVRRRRGRVGPGLHFAVIDDGPGIPTERRQALLDPDPHRVIDLAQPGCPLGLGVALSRRYVHDLGGALRLRSQPGCGTVFHFSVPCELSAATAATAPAPRTALPSSSPAQLRGLADRIPLRILGADDVATNRRVLSIITRQLGYACDLVEDGSQVLERLQRQPYDLLLLDVQMPVLDGLSTAREIRRRWPADRGPRIVAVTANALLSHRDECLQAGMDDFLPKPVLTRALAACIERLFALPPPPPWVDWNHWHGLTDGMPDDEAASLCRDMVREAERDFASVLPALTEACAQHDLTRLATIAHGHKGGLLSLGWTRAADHCRRTLQAARDGTFDQWDALPDEVRRLWDDSRTALLAGPPLCSPPASHHVHAAP